mmetsp:Transcript_63952/g.113716  ORF Transcript_63952/g.113716 Transcript_63952/m.113716 type:complete len:302 (+) Transcript_63952:22-927(+)
MAFFTRYTVADLPLPSGLISLRQPNDTFFSAIQVLCEHHLLSAPVLSADGEEVLGMVDSLDVVARMVKLTTASETELKDVPIEDIMGLGVPAGKVSFEKVSLEDTLDKVLEIVSGPARRAIVLKEGRPHSVVTQSVMLQFLYDNRDKIEGLHDCGSAKELCSDGAVCVKENDTALSAFQLINSVGVWSLAIVDEDGCMVSVVSATDLVIGLRHMEDKTTALASLAECSVTDLVVNNRSLDLKDKASTKASTVTAQPDQPLESILSKLAVCRVHRVVVCSERKPVGVLSLTDVCRAVAGLKA